MLGNSSSSAKLSPCCSPLRRCKFNFFKYIYPFVVVVIAEDDVWLCVFFVGFFCFFVCFLLLIIYLVINLKWEAELEKAELTAAGKSSQSYTLVYTTLQSSNLRWLWILSFFFRLVQCWVISGVVLVRTRDPGGETKE